MVRRQLEHTLITARCPSCAAVVTFSHGTSVAAVCATCRSTVVRTDRDVRAYGRVSAFSRDLSPIRIGAEGLWRDRHFVVIGVLRKGRDRVRWNEWLLRFEDDGETAWLGEGNGTWRLYDVRRACVASELTPGGRVSLAGFTWQVMEVGVARVIAADGELPGVAFDGSEEAYADLALPGRAEVGTFEVPTRPDQPGTLWVGVEVALPDLKLVGLRMIAGFADPDLRDFAGADVEGTRSIRCPACTAPITLFAPGDATTVGCAACGTVSSVEDVAGEQVARAHEGGSAKFTPTIALGSIGAFEGVPWQVIGAIERVVINAWGSWPWVEYLLYNPYRGYRWLVEDGTSKHWNFVVPMAGAPTVQDGRVEHDGHTYRHFQEGTPEVHAVLGELTWEVHRGDQARSNDWVAPPYMLSREDSASEVVWSLGTYVPVTDVEAAFKVQLPAPSGVAPNQPNPFAGDAGWGLALRNGAVLSVAALAVWALALLLSPGTVLVEQQFLTTPVGPDVWLTEPFVVPEAFRDDVEVVITTNAPRSEAMIYVALLGMDDGTAHLTRVSSGTDASGSARLDGLVPGTYVARLEVAKPKEEGNTSTQAVSLRVEHAKRNFLPLILALVMPLLAPVVLWAVSGAFENRRWAESDHA